MVKSLPSTNLVTGLSTGDGVTNFRWDTVNIGTGIEVTNDKKNAFLREGPYMFRTIIGDTVITLTL